MKKITIAGAGPAGLSAAIHLSRSGYPVEVFERRQDVGARFIGEYQILENYTRREDVLDDLAQMGIETNFELLPIDWASLYDDRDKLHRVSSSKPYGYFLKRGTQPGTLDQGLSSQARKLGAVIHFGKKIAPEEADIVATGPGPADGIAKEIAFRTDSADRVDVIFDPELAPGGYAYFFVLKGWATLGLALLEGYSRLETQFEKAVERFRALGPFDIEAPRSGYSYMNFFLHGSSRSKEALFAGEAGGFQDYIFGLGIRYALVSGHLAARSIVENADYDRLWSDRFLGMMRSSLSMRLFYEALGHRGLRLFVWQAARADFRKFLYSWARPAWWRLAVRPFAERIFGKAGECGHKIPCTWCRPREGRAGKPEPLPEDFVKRYLEQ